MKNYVYLSTGTRVRKVIIFIQILILLTQTSLAVGSSEAPTSSEVAGEACLAPAVDPLSQPSIEKQMTAMCSVALKSEACLSLPEEDLRDCTMVSQGIQTNFWDFIVGCTEGVFESAKETLSFIWEVLKWTWSNLTSSEARSETVDQVSEYANIIKLYLHTEYEKSYQETAPPFRTIKAVKSMGGAISKALYDFLKNLVIDQYEEFNCLNEKAQSQVMCKFIGDIFIPPAAVLAMLKGGIKAKLIYPNISQAFNNLVKDKAGRIASKAAIGLDSSFPSRPLREYYRYVGSWGGDVPFHTLNADELLESLRKQKNITTEFVPFSKGIDNKLEQVFIKDANTSFIVVDKVLSKDGKLKTVILKDIMGQWIEVPATRLDKSTAVSLNFSKAKYVPSKDPDLEIYTAPLKRLHGDLKLDTMTSEELADYLTSRQLKSSTNSNKVAGKAKVEFDQGVKDANLMISKLVLEDKGEFKLTHLQQLNELANRGVDPYEWSINKPMAGVVRGTREKRLHSGKEIEVNLTEFEVAQQWKMALPAPTRVNYFLPSDEVPKATEALLTKINTINESTSPEQVFKLYKEFIHVHPFADGNGRTGRMLLNYMLLKAKLPPVSGPAPSLFYRSYDAHSKYISSLEKNSGLKLAARDYDFVKMNSFSGIKDIDALGRAIKEQYGLSKVSLDHLYGTSGYLFVGVYKGRYIQFESTHFGDLSDTVEKMIGGAQKIIDEQEIKAIKQGLKPQTYAIYPELLDQPENYHFLYQRDFLKNEFKAKNKREPSSSELVELEQRAHTNTALILEKAETIKDDHEFFKQIMQAPKLEKQAKTVEEVSEDVLTITSPAYKRNINAQMTQKASKEMKESFVSVYNAFNSDKYDNFMIEMAERSLELCRRAKECGPTQRLNIPDKYLAEILATEAKKLGVPLETISKFVGREPGRLYALRIKRGSLMIDDGAPGNHGMMPHGLQNLFIYRTLGVEKGKEFFAGLTGWVYERMFDSNLAFTPIPSTRDITRRHYWSGVFKAGNRAEVSRWGEVIGESGRYPEFLRQNGLSLVEVQEVEKNLINAGSKIRARYKDQEFEFYVDRDGVPLPESKEIEEQIRKLKIEESRP